MTQLYLISPPTLEPAAFAKQLEAALAAGRVGAFQLRLKDASDEQILAAAKVLQPICAAHNAAFVLNDRPDLVRAADADGVHLGQEDLQTWPVKKARAVVGDECIIGVSCHASRHMAMEAGEQGADYVAFGAFYPTKSKPMEKLAKYGTPTPEILEWWAETTVLPSVAIGGINPANCLPLIKAGADFIAVLSYVWEHAQGPAAAVQEFRKELT